MSSPAACGVGNPQGIPHSGTIFGDKNSTNLRGGLPIGMEALGNSHGDIAINDANNAGFRKMSSR